MKKHMITIGVAALIVGGLMIINHYEPKRATMRALEKEQQAQAEISQGEAIESSIQDPILAGRERARKAAGAPSDSEIEMAKASASPGAFKVQFECSNGTFVAEFYPEWAPIGAAHIKELVENNVLDGTSFFRVIEGFMAQFGIPADPAVSAKWSGKNIQDEPVLQTNERGTITFAKSQLPNSRSTQLFINFVDNSRLDKSGFSPIGRVVEGMDVVDALNSTYGHAPSELQEQMKLSGYAVLNERYPGLDSIKTVRIISSEQAPNDRHRH